MKADAYGSRDFSPPHIIHSTEHNFPHESKRDFAFFSMPPSLFGLYVDTFTKSIVRLEWSSKQHMIHQSSAVDPDLFQSNVKINYAVLCSRTFQYTVLSKILKIMTVTGTTLTRKIKQL